MGVSTDLGRFFCETTGTVFGPDFGDAERGNAFLVFLGHYPEDWTTKPRTKPSPLGWFTPDPEKDPRKLSEEELADAFARFEAQEIRELPRPAVDLVLAAVRYAVRV